LAGGIIGCLHAVGGPDLAEDVSEVTGHSVKANEQLLRHFPKTIPDQL